MIIHINNSGMDMGNICSCFWVFRDLLCIYWKSAKNSHYRCIGIFIDGEY